MSSRLRAIKNAKMAEKRQQIREDIMASENGGMTRKEMGNHILYLQKRMSRQDRIIAGLNTQNESLRMFLMFLVDKMGGELSYTKEDIKKFYDVHELNFEDDEENIKITVLLHQDVTIDTPTAEVEVGK